MKEVNFRLFASEILKINLPKNRFHVVALLYHFFFYLNNFEILKKQSFHYKLIFIFITKQNFQSNYNSLQNQNQKFM